MALAPALALMFYFYRQDRREPEPRGKVAKVMLWGALCVAPSIWWEMAYGPSTLPREGWPLIRYAFAVVAFPEELCKLLAIMVSIFRDPEFDEPMDGIVYGVAASLGFAALENVLYVLGKGEEVGLVRALLTVPCHAFSGATMGYCLGVTHFSPARARLTGALGGLLLATLMHGLFDFCCFHHSLRMQLLIFPLTCAYAALALTLVRRLQ